MSYTNRYSRSGATPNDLVDVKASAYSYKDGGTSLSVGGVKAKGGFDDSDYGIGVRGKAGVHVLKYKDFNNKVAVKAFAAKVKASAGIDMEALTKKDKVIGYELKAKATLVEGKAGPIFLHIGAGYTTGSNISDATLKAKLAGNGIHIGKRIGVSLNDNELSIETLSLFGKGWLWGEFV
ncbi:dxs [Mytilus edulis]|uniref:Dxs n=1 Tax=Mytilus edulis TaxID=6550 RepID=A0A8S3QH34_MYTED|nr:dxs [Mytilus edulis]